MARFFFLIISPKQGDNFTKTKGVTASESEWVDFSEDKWHKVFRKTEDGDSRWI